ncbi:hypothetical protein [Oscillatoria acuminata]|uniref:Uncharacterized protein n=1 Tax=Oscillatoria acuminata PCC 6304 TaxID=56110 RepID=K9TNM2_9CYAN|nr:hypothetical protein [Oscillatoria acuminata]AFY83998.1 hypothetical protein Oscil6304_4481 [Oscillatoria acuminata PCC 6304]
MNLKTSVDTAIDRILAINWEPDDSRTSSHVALLQEYLRRAALWAVALDCTEEWPFFDVAAHISPSFQPENRHLDRLEQHFSQVPFYVTKVIENTCRWFVKWEGVKHLPEVSSYVNSNPENLLEIRGGVKNHGQKMKDVYLFSVPLPHPYEPLILLYDRGGIFYSEHRFFCFEDAAVPRGTWREHWQPEAAVCQLNAEALDNLDGNFEENRFTAEC